MALGKHTRTGGGRFRRSGPIRWQVSSDRTIQSSPTFDPTLSSGTSSGILGSRLMRRSTLFARRFEKADK